MSWYASSSAGRGRSAQRHSIHDDYNDRFDPNYRRNRHQQTAQEIEQDRQYAELLAQSYGENDAQIARDQQLAIELSRQRSASPRRDLDLEVALQMSRDRSDPNPRRRHGDRVEALDSVADYNVRALSSDQPGMQNNFASHFEHSARPEEPEVVVEYDMREPDQEGSDEDGMEREERPERAEGNCVVCGDRVTNRNSIGLTCGHRICSESLIEMFNHAMTDEALFPPRCCVTHEVPVDEARVLLGVQFPEGFDERAEEMQTADRTYCHVSDCSAFIPPDYIRRHIANCPDCEAQTCSICKHARHRRGDCPQDPALQQIEEMARENGWTRCNNCRSMVELRYGCNHMTCRCGHQFCYVCGTAWRNCNCPQFGEDNLYRRAEAVRNRPRRRRLEVLALPLAEDDEDYNIEEQRRRLEDFQRQAPAHVIQAAPGRRPRDQRPRGRRRNNGIDAHVGQLLQDLRANTALRRHVDEEARRARTHRFANTALRPADIDDIAAHLRENHECTHERRWRRFHVGVNACEICQRVKANPAVGECPTCFLQACYHCRRHRMRAGE